MKCAHILLENLSITYSDFNLLFYLWPISSSQAFFPENVYVCFYMFLNMRLYHYSPFHLYLPKTFLFNFRKKELAFKYFGFERT